MVVYDYPKDTVVFGPQQVEARIDQDARISQLLSLWNQQGSHVIRGNMLVLPIENSTLYVEPLYLQASQSQIPELKRVILATENRLVIGSTLAQSRDVLDGKGGASRGGTLPALTDATAPAPSGSVATATPATTGAVVGSSDVPALALDAQSHFDKAQEALKSSDWATYGKEMQA